MKERVVVSAHGSAVHFYQDSADERWREAIAHLAPPGWDGLCCLTRPWAGAPWDDLVRRRDPTAFQHLLSDRFISRGWTSAVLAINLAPCHIGTQGLQAWYRVGAVLAGLTLLKEKNVLSS